MTDRPAYELEENYPVSVVHGHNNERLVQLAVWNLIWGTRVYMLVQQFFSPPPAFCFIIFHRSSQQKHSIRQYLQIHDILDCSKCGVRPQSAASSLFFVVIWYLYHMTYQEKKNHDGYMGLHVIGWSLCAGSRQRVMLLSIIQSVSQSVTELIPRSDSYILTTGSLWIWSCLWSLM